MQRHVILVAVAVASTIGLGCRSHQLAYDQDHIRSAVMDLHTNQIMDNLVRVRKGLPILQLDYTNMTGTVTQTGGLTGGGSQTVAGNSFFNIPAAQSAIRRVFTGVGNLSASAQQVNQLTLTAQPILNAPDVYNAYLAYMKNGDHLRESSCPPPCDAAVAVRCYNADCDETCSGCDGCGRHGWLWWRKRERPKVYYWIPVEYRDDFRRLSLYTVAVRGQPIAVSPNFEVTVLGVVNTKQNAPGVNAYTARLKLDKKIPNDQGYLIANVNGRLIQTPGVITVLGDPKKPPASPNDPSADTRVDEIEISFKLKDDKGEGVGVEKLDDFVKAIDRQKVGVRLENFIPTGSQTDRLLDDIRTQLELSRLGQVR